MDRITALEKHPESFLRDIVLAGDPAPVQTVAVIDQPLLSVYAKFADKLQCDPDQTTLSYRNLRDVQVPRRTGELLSILPYWGGDPCLIARRLDGYRFVVYRTTASNFRSFRAIVAKDTGRGYYVEETLHITPLISTDVLAAACFDALSEGKIVTRDNMPDTPGTFSRYCLLVSIGIVSCQLRLDHALAFLKIAGKPSDAYGDRVAGVIPYHFDMRAKCRKWKIVYELDSDGNEVIGGVASIDHVKAKANGGEDHLANMNLMRKDRNSEKSDAPADVLPDPISTMEVLDVLISGAKTGKESGALDGKVYDDIIELAAEEYSSCKRTADWLHGIYSKQARKAGKRARELAGPADKLPPEKKGKRKRKRTGKGKARD